jgi:hypothetical protein
MLRDVARGEGHEEGEEDGGTLIAHERDSDAERTDERAAKLAARVGDRPPLLFGPTTTRTTPAVTSLCGFCRAAVGSRAEECFCAELLARRVVFAGSCARPIS